MLVLHDLTLNFGGVRALRGLNAEIPTGALHGLIGPNGAGKTTALNVISGLHRPGSGSMTLAGAPYAPTTHRLAAGGVARTFQAAATVDSLTALANVLLGGHSWTRAGVLASALRLPAAQREERALRERARAALAEVGYVAAEDARMAALTPWQRRQIEIARALMVRPKLLLLDEPAAGLTAGEVGELKALLNRLRRHAGTTVLLVEHNVPLVFSLCDSVTAMAEGRDIAQGPCAAVRSHPEVIRAYLGAADRPVAAAPAPPAAAGPPVLQLQGVASGYGANMVLHDIAIDVRAGETVALFGPNGAGKSTLFNTIIGERRVRAGAIVWHGQRID